MKVAGFGFRAGATEQSLADAFQACGARVTALAAPEDKAVANTFVAYAKALGLPIVAVSQEALAQQETRTQSAASRAARKTGSVAEAAALAGAGIGARLVTSRQISQDRMATCAVAEGDDA